MLARTLSLASLVVLSACAGTRPDPTAPADSGPSAAEMAGSWTFVASRGGHVLSGSIEVEPDGAGQFVLPEFVVDPTVVDPELEIEGAEVRWSGTLRTTGGPGRFRIVGVVEGDTLRGTNEIQSVGTYRFEAIRVR